MRMWRVRISATHRKYERRLPPIWWITSPRLKSLSAKTPLVLMQEDLTDRSTMHLYCVQRIRGGRLGTTLPDIGSQGVPERYQLGAGRPMVRVSQRFG